MNSNVTYQLIGDRAILIKCESKCVASKITLNFVNSEPDSHVIVGNGTDMRIYNITNGHSVIDLNGINTDVLSMRVSKTVSPLKLWRCDELIIVKNQDGQFRLFPDSTRMLEAISKLRIHKKEAAIKLQAFEQRLKNLEGEVNRLAGGFITE